MCGILGFIHTSGINSNQLNSSLFKIARRGPDHQGSTQIDHESFFAHSRLSIIDLSERGHQPYSFQQLVITFNGMIYNYRSIRDELRDAGYKFESSSDTEVLIKAWHFWGPKSLDKLEGFFSFGLYDRNKKVLFLCRDKIGKKPLYWRKWHGGLVFASRLDAIETLTQPEPVCPEAVQWLFYLKYIPEPLTAVKDIHKLERGHLLKFDKNGVQIEKWGGLQGVDQAKSNPLAASTANLKLSIEEAVNSRLVADVPISCLLSGGIDSTVIATIASRSVRLNTFTLAIESKKNKSQFDESLIARQTAKELRSNHHEIRLNEQAVLNSIEHLFNRVFDEPIADPAAVLNQHIFKHVSEFSKVCITGDGADEIFGGYRRHQGHLLSNHFAFNNVIAKRIIGYGRSLIPDRRETWALEQLRYVARFLKAAEYASDSGHRWLVNTDITGSMFRNDFDHATAFDRRVEDQNVAGPELDQINKMLALELLSTIPNQMMVKVDRTSMDTGLEVRSPFLDQKVIELAFTRSGKDKVRFGRGKALLRSMFKAELPSHVLKQRKRGFDLPVLEMLEGPLRQQLENALCKDFHAEIGIRSETVDTWVASTKAHKSNAAANHLWTLMGLKQWHAQR